MGNKATKTNGGVWISVHTDKNDKDHIDIYDKNPREKHEESIHITLEDEGNGTITTKSGDSGRETTDTKCYLTTACMKHMMETFRDDCEELTILRRFRDCYVSKEDIDHYYKTAPIIVESINRIPNRDTIYRYIYDNVVRACVEAIKQGNYDFALDRYKNSTLVLEEQFARRTLEEKFVKSLRYRITSH